MSQRPYQKRFRRKSLNKEECIKLIMDKYILLNKVPLSSYFTTHEQGYMRYLFGSYNNALKECGFDNSLINEGSCAKQYHCTKKN